MLKLRTAITIVKKLLSQQSIMGGIMSVVFATKWENREKYFPGHESAAWLPGQARPAKCRARGHYCGGLILAHA
jgi:hypothetical protein